MTPMFGAPSGLWGSPWGRQGTQKLPNIGRGQRRLPGWELAQFLRVYLPIMARRAVARAILAVAFGVILGL